MSPQRIITFVFLGLIALYALFQARFLILGPRIEVDSPVDGSVLSGTHADVAGTAKNVTDISLDGRPISIDQNGRFEEQLLLPAGPSIISLTAHDRFGRGTEKELYVVVTQ